MRKHAHGRTAVEAETHTHIPLTGTEAEIERAAALCVTRETRSLLKLGMHNL